MATIREIIGKDGKKTYRAQIRKKNYNFSSYFKDFTSAELWAKYKEMIVDEMEAFSLSGTQLYDVETTIKLKYDENSRERDITLEFFKPFLTFPIEKFTYEMMMDHCTDRFNTLVHRGGGKTKSKNLVPPKPMTLLRKFAYLSAAISNLKKLGYPVKNEALNVIAQLRMFIEEEKDDKS